MYLPSSFVSYFVMQSIVSRDQSIFMLIVQGIYSTEHYKSNFDQGQFVLVHKSASANYSSAVENFWGQNKIGNASLSIQIIIGNHFCLVQKEAFFSSFLFLLVLFSCRKFTVNIGPTSIWNSIQIFILGQPLHLTEA